MGVISKGGIRGEKKGPVVLASTVIRATVELASTVIVTVLIKSLALNSFNLILIIFRWI